MRRELSACLRPEDAKCDAFVRLNEGNGTWLASRSGRCWTLRDRCTRHRGTVRDWRRTRCLSVHWHFLVKKILLFSVTSLCLCGMNFSENCQKFQLELIYFDLIEVKATRVLPLFSAAFWVRSPVATKPLSRGYALLKKSKECEWAGPEWAELVPKIEDHFNSFTSVILWILEWNFTGRWLLMWSLNESLGPGP